MNDFTGEFPSRDAANQPAAPNREISDAAWTWLTAHQACSARTEPVIAIVRALLEVMTDGLHNDDEVHAGLRRAVRLLSTFTVHENIQPLNS